MADITVLRLSHRAGRDPRMSTHLGLTSRVYGATRFLLSGDNDSAVLQSLHDVGERFGGEMEAVHEPSPLGFLKRFVADGGIAVHLTMYGLPYQEVVPELPQDKPIVIVVGGAKVGREFYEVCQHNVAVGSQPHSEVAALTAFLERLVGGVAPPQHFTGGKLFITPSERGKDLNEN